MVLVDRETKRGVGLRLHVYAPGAQVKAQVARRGELRQLLCANMAVVTQVAKPANDIAAFELANKY